MYLLSLILPGSAFGVVRAEGRGRGPGRLDGSQEPDFDVPGLRFLKDPGLEGLDDLGVDDLGVDDLEVL